MISYMRTPWGRLRELDEHSRDVLAGMSGRGEAALDDLADTLSLVRALALIVSACALAAFVIYAVRGVE